MMLYSMFGLALVRTCFKARSMPKQQIVDVDSTSVNWALHVPIQTRFYTPMLIVKCLFVFWTGLYPKPMPLWLVILWSSVGVGIVSFLVLWSWHLHRSLERKRRWFFTLFVVVGILFFDSFLIFMGIIYSHTLCKYYYYQPLS